jgi:hypothetical protein
LGNPQQYEPVYANNKNVYDAVVYGYKLAKPEIEKLNEQVKVAKEALEIAARYLKNGAFYDYDDIILEAMQKLQEMKEKNGK